MGFVHLITKTSPVDAVDFADVPQCLGRRFLPWIGRAGLTGFEFGTAYAASKFGLEGWMQSLQAEVEPFGINTLTVNPGFLSHRASHGGIDEFCGTNY